jgi:AcrR family transcriptional regulator
VRISKKYEERKDELLQAAEQLFCSQGYDQTSVNNIIDAVGVSKGTFYHYFKSKEYLLDCLADKIGHDILREVNAVANDEGFDALDKFRKALDVTRRLQMANKDLVLTMIKVLYRDENIVIRHKIDTRNLELLKPEFSRIIKQGIEERSFAKLNPDDAAETILLLANQTREIIAKLLLQLQEEPATINVIERKLMMFGHSIEKILCVPDNSMGIPDRDFMKIFLMEG